MLNKHLSLIPFASSFATEVAICECWGSHCAVIPCRSAFTAFAWISSPCFRQGAVCVKIAEGQRACCASRPDSSVVVQRLGVTNGLCGIDARICVARSQWHSVAALLIRDLPPMPSLLSIRSRHSSTTGLTLFILFPFSHKALYCAFCA